MQAQLKRVLRTNRLGRPKHPGRHAAITLSEILCRFMPIMLPHSM